MNRHAGDVRASTNVLLKKKHEHLFLLCISPPKFNRAVVAFTNMD